MQITGFGGAIAEVQSANRALHIGSRPFDYGALGHYEIGLSSGLLTGVGVTAGGTLFSVRWTDSTRFMIPTRISAYYTVTTAFTAAQELGLDAIVARAYTVTDTVGTAITLGGNNQKMRTSMASSLITSAAAMRIAAATIITAGTRTLDANPFIGASGVTHDVNAAAGTAQLIATPKIGFDWLAEMGDGEHPLFFAQDEGFVIRNTIVFPAAGVARLWVRLKWIEVPATVLI